MKKYCYSCDDYVDIEIIEKEESITINNIIINVITDLAYCKQCNNKVYVFELANELIKKLNKKYESLKKVRGRHG